MGVLRERGDHRRRQGRVGDGRSHLSHGRRVEPAQSEVEAARQAGHIGHDPCHGVSGVDVGVAVRSQHQESGIAGRASHELEQRE